MATSPFANAGLQQFGQEISSSDPSMGKFLLGAFLSQFGAPKEVTDFATGKPVAPPATQMSQSGFPAIPGQPMQNPEDERMSFSKGFGSLFSHLPTFGK